MPSRIFFSCSLLILLILSSCNKADKTDLEYNVDAEFIISLQEKLTRQSNYLQLHTETLSKTYCPGTNIVVKNKSNLSANEIHLDIENIMENDECISKDDIAQSDVTFSKLDDGTYTFKINLANTVPNEGQLSVTPQGYSLVLHSFNGISAGKINLNRIPDYAMWGYITHDGSESASEASEDLFKMISENYQEASLSNGYYGHFEIESGNVDFPAEESLNEIHKFAFITTDDFDNLEEDIKAFKSDEDIKLLFDSGKMATKFYYYNGEVF